MFYYIKPLIRPPQFHTCIYHFICLIASSKTQEIQGAKCSEISISTQLYFINHPEAGVELDHSIFQVICGLQGPPCTSCPEKGIFAAEQELKHLQIRTALSKAQTSHYTASINPMELDHPKSQILGLYKTQVHSSYSQIILPYINLHIFSQKYNQRLLKVTQFKKQTLNPYLSISQCMNYYNKAVLAFIIFLMNCE